MLTLLAWHDMAWHVKLNTYFMAIWSREEWDPLSFFNGNKVQTQKYEFLFRGIRDI